MKFMCYNKEKGVEKYLEFLGSNPIYTILINGCALAEVDNETHKHSRRKLASIKWSHDQKAHLT